MDRIAVILGGIHNYVLFSLLLWQLHKRQQKMEFSTNMKIMNGFALLSLFLNGFFGLARAPVSFGVWPESITSCTLQSAFMAIIWFSGKLSLYVVCIMRLDVAFRNSQFQLNMKSFTFLYGLIGIGYVTQLIIVLLFWNGTMVTSWGLTYCAPDVDAWVFLVLVLWDFIVSCSMLYLFVKKLYQCQANRRSVSDREQTKFWSLVTKYVTLTDVGVLSTILGGFGIGATQWVVFTVIDTVINSWCVVLMYSDNKKMYDKLCFCCKKYCGQMCIYKVTKSRLYSGDIEFSSTKHTISIGNKNKKKSSDFSKDMDSKESKSPKMSAVDSKGSFGKSDDETDDATGNSNNSKRVYAGYTD